MSFLTTKELAERWRLENIDSARRMLHRYSDILAPVKIGRALLVELENVKKFEGQMRIVK